MPTPQQYSQTDAQVLMTLSAVAYAGEDGPLSQVQAAITSALAGATLLNGGYTLSWLGITQDRANVVYVTRGGGALNVAVRGTDWNFLVDWIDDFDVTSYHAWPTAAPPNADIQVAQGAWDGLQALLGTTSQVDGSGAAVPLAAYLQAEAQAASAAGSTLAINVTGHSLGGAMATVLGLWIADTVPSWNVAPGTVAVNNYTFAAPTVGNQAFADYYNGQAGNAQVAWQAFRVYNEQDVVPHGFASLDTLVSTGIPMTLSLMLKVGTVAVTVNAVLEACGVSYVQVGTAGSTAQGLSNDPPKTGGAPGCTGSTGAVTPCANPADSMADFGCWACYEHDHNNYLILLGAPPVAVTYSAVDVAGIARLEPRVVGAQALVGEPANV
jgi:hypothetical protein